MAHTNSASIHHTIEVLSAVAVNNQAISAVILVVAVQ
jgi:hypothetical protein